MAKPLPSAVVVCPHTLFHLSMKPLHALYANGVKPMIFVFGSNLAGRHGAGAAKYACTARGAKYGVGIGRTGECYALPTKDHGIRTLHLETIAVYVATFIEYAKANQDCDFQVTRIGCGLAGLNDSDIAPMFKNAPSNCYFDNAWSPYLGAQHNYWGSF